MDIFFIVRFFNYFPEEESDELLTSMGLKWIVVKFHYSEKFSLNVVKFKAKCYYVIKGDAGDHIVGKYSLIN